MRVAAIVLAAGEGRRLGGPKALLPLGAGTFAAAAAGCFARAGIDATLVVLGAQAERVASGAGLPTAARIVVNPRWAEGMLTSVWAGLDAAQALGAEAVLLHPVDNPLVREATVTAVLAALARGAIVAVPSHGGRRGHPAGFAREAWPALREAPITGGARFVLGARPEWVEHVPAGPDCRIDIDTPEDLEALRRGLAGDG